jgi:hypothetical protein
MEALFNQVFLTEWLTPLYESYGKIQPNQKSSKRLRKLYLAASAEIQANNKCTTYVDLVYEWSNARVYAIEDDDRTGEALRVSDVIFTRNVAYAAHTPFFSVTDLARVWNHLTVPQQESQWKIMERLLRTMGMTKTIAPVLPANLTEELQEMKRQQAQPMDVMEHVMDKVLNQETGIVHQMLQGDMQAALPTMENLKNMMLRTRDPKQNAFMDKFFEQHAGAMSALQTNDPSVDAKSVEDTKQQQAEFQEFVKSMRNDKGKFDMKNMLRQSKEQFQQMGLDFPDMQQMKNQIQQAQQSGQNPMDLMTSMLGPMMSQLQSGMIPPTSSPAS